MEKKKYRRWTKQSIIQEICVISDYSAKSAQRVRPELYGAAVRHFGSWKKAIEASGLDYQRVRKKHPLGYWSAQTVIEQIGKLQKMHSAFVRKNNADLYNAGLRIFGSWEKAIAAAGLDYKSIKRSFSSKR